MCNHLEHYLVEVEIEQRYLVCALLERNSPGDVLEHMLGGIELVGLQVQAWLSIALGDSYTSHTHLTLSFHQAGIAMMVPMFGDGT